MSDDNKIAELQAQIDALKAAQPAPYDPVADEKARAEWEAEMHELAERRARHAMPPAVVREMATALENVSERDVEFFRGESLGPINCPNRERASYLSVEVLRDLKRMFRAYADAEAALESSW